MEEEAALVVAEVKQDVEAAKKITNMIVKLNGELMINQQAEDETMDHTGGSSKLGWVALVGGALVAAGIYQYKKS